MSNRISSGGVYIANPGSVLEGEVTIPGDKSLSHRALILGALAEGVTIVEGLLESWDCLRTLKVLEQLGVRINQPDNGRLVIDGVGLRGLHESVKPLYFGNSGTGLRLMAGVLAGSGFRANLTGDDSLNCRPMERIATPLRMMGAEVETQLEGTPPLHIKGPGYLKGLNYSLPIASAQVKSCCLLAGLFTDENVTIVEPVVTRDHTERLLNQFGVCVERDANCVKMAGKRRLNASNVHIPGDFSSAAYLIVGATLSPASDILIKNVGVNPTRIGLLHILHKMGANITLENERVWGNEPVADIRVVYAPLTGITVPPDWAHSAIDEIPILCIAAACARGETQIRQVADLKNKESDRISVMAVGLSSLGIQVKTFDDGLCIKGGQLQGGVVDSLADHRVAMSFSVGGHCAKKQVVIRDTKNVATSFPNFVATARKVGMAIEEKNYDV